MVAMWKCENIAKSNAANAQLVYPGSTLGCRERAACGTFRVLIYGNSIALHGRAPKIGWHGDWGMAASALAFPARENGNTVRLVGTPLDREIIDECRRLESAEPIW